MTGESDSGVDIPASRKRIALALLSHSFSRVAWLILDCARRTGSIYLDPSKLACFSLLERHPCWSTWDRRTRLHIIRPTLLVLSWGWGLIDLPLRASNEGLLRPRVARAQKIIRLHPPLCSGSTRPTWVSFQSFYRARSANRRTARLPHPFFSSRLN